MKTAMETHIGYIRSVNEDRVFVKPDLHGYILAVVADGMGGHRAGDIASHIAVEKVNESLQQNWHGDHPAEQAISEAIANANSSVFAAGCAQEEYHGMGTTIVVVLANEEHAVIGHIGDSRAYLFNGEQLQQVTEDHSLVNELLRNGQITEEEADAHPRRNVLTRALGTEPNVCADVVNLPWKRHDILLVCSDGLSDHVEKQVLVDILKSEHSLEKKAKMMVESALATGGDDNVTVLLLENSNTTGETEGSQ